MIHVVALHGIQGSRQGWLPLAALCGDVGSFIVPDLRGRGDGLRGSTVDDYRLQDFADDVSAVIDAQIGNQPFVLAGWSMGASVALEYLSGALSHRPQGLILISATPCLAQTNWFSQDGDALLDEVAERERRLGIKGGADHQAVAWTWTAIRQSDQRPVLASVQVPALIIHGSDDEDCPVAHAHTLADGIANARLHIIEGAGHSLLTRNTEAVAGPVRVFLKAWDSRL